MNPALKNRLVGASLASLVLVLVAATINMLMAPIVVPTVADMLLLNPHDRIGTVRVLGLNSQGDWGEGRYFRVVATSSISGTNAVRRVSPVNPSWAFVHKWDGNAQTFGAFPDDINDDTQALQAAADEAVLRRLTVYLPAGDSGGIYRVTNTIVMTNQPLNRVQGGGFRGDGIGRSRIYHTGFNQSVLKIRGLGMTVAGLTIGYENIQGVTNTSSIALELSGFNSSHDIADFQLINAHAGLKATSDVTGYAGFSLTVRNGIIENCDQGIDIPSGSGNLFYNIYISSYGLPHATRAIIDRSGVSRYDVINTEHSNYRAAPLAFQGSGASIGRLHYEGNRLLNSEPIMAIQRATVDVDQFTIINSYFHGHMISSITRVGATATATVDRLGDAITGGHGVAVGDTVYILGATDALYNGANTVTSVTKTNFTYTMSGVPAADAVVDLAGGYDYFSAHRGTASSSLSSIIDTSAYESPRLNIGTLKLRDNRIINASSANRNGILAVNELLGRSASITVNEVDTGEPSNPMASLYLAANPVVALSVASSIATVWTRYPHMFSTNEPAYFQANTPARRTSTNWTVLSTPTPWSFTVNIGGSDLDLTREVGSGFCAPVVTTVTNLSRSGNIATAKCSTPHYLKVGYKGGLYNAALSGFTSLNLVALSVPDDYTFTYRSTGADAGPASENQAVLAVYDAGISEFLSVSTQSPLKDFGHLFRQSFALSSNAISAGSFDLTTNTVNGVRVGDIVSVGIINASTFDPSLVLYPYVNAANSVVVRRQNVGASSITNVANVLSVAFKRL